MGLELRWPKFPCEFGHDGPHFSNLIIGTEREKGKRGRPSLPYRVQSVEKFSI